MKMNEEGKDTILRERGRGQMKMNEEGEDTILRERETSWKQYGNSAMLADA